MRIEALESIKSGPYVLDEGDRKSVPDEIGQRWCALGWAKDVDGVVPTGERVVTRNTLEVHNVKIGVADTLEETSHG